MKTIGNAMLLKDINKRMVLNELRKHEPVSRANLVKITKLALPTVLRIVNSLIDEGLIIEIGKEDTASGRKPIMLEINKHYGYFIGVNIGTFLTAILTDFKGNILDKLIVPIEDQEDPIRIVKQIDAISEQLITTHKIAVDNVIGMGVATPGTGFKIGSQKKEFQYYAWHDVDFNQLLKKHKPTIKTLSEYNTICAAIGEQWFGVGKGVKDFVYITVDSGVGSGIIIHDKVYRGKDGYAGHIGHHIVNVDGETCYCGNKGCLEMYTSATTIVRKVKDALDNGALSSMTNEAVDTIDFNRVVKAYNEGDPLTMDIISEAGRIMGYGVANAINIFNPDMVILGGDVINNFPIFLEKVKDIALSHIFGIKAKNVLINRSMVNKYPEAQGAVALVMKEIYKMPVL